MNRKIENAIFSMARGLAFWMGYRQYCYSGHRMKEYVAVEQAVKILRMHLDGSNFKIKCEYPYRECFKSYNGRYLADIVICKNDKAICILEFKIADCSEKKLADDIRKMAPFSTDSVALYEMVIFEGKSQKMRDLLTIKNRIKRTISIGNQSVLGRRFFKAWESEKIGYPSVAILQIRQIKHKQLSNDIKNCKQGIKELQDILKKEQERLQELEAQLPKEENN